MSGGLCAGCGASMPRDCTCPEPERLYPRSIIVRLHAEDAAALEELNAAEQARGEPTPRITAAETFRRLLRRAHRWHVQQKEKGR